MRTNAPGPSRAAAILAIAAVVSMVSQSSAVEAQPAPSLEAARDPDLPPAAAARPPVISASRRALAVAGSLLPGALVHGTGHYMLGRPRTGTRLLALEGAGVLALVSSFTVLALTGAARDLVGPTIGVAIAGGGMFTVSWLADVFGAAVPLSSRGAAARSAPFLVAELGYRYIHDIQFNYRSFAALGVTARYDQLRLSASAWQSLNDDNGRYRLLGAYRLIGPTPAQMAETGSFLDVELAGTHHRYGSEGFGVSTGEVLVGGRLDLTELDPLLRGSFAELGLGWALARTDYGAARDYDPLLLGGFAFGAYVGDPATSGGEVRAFYDHRHDGYAAGLKVAGLGSGALGHFGLDGRWFIDDRWGVLLEAQAGSAIFFGASLLMRQARQP